jgi:hypothetical protein
MDTVNYVTDDQFDAAVKTARNRSDTAIAHNPMTPWGRSQHATVVAPGIVRHMTAGHGGYLLDAAATKKVYAKFPTFKTFSGVKNAFEEDCDWAYVALTFPALFPAEALQVAEDIVKRYGKKSRDGVKEKKAATA